ncbi:hypothetical protein [Halobiforma nitratireducens]|uniref:Cohesin domain-containing protein n=1 Tax=Halobiforma nitratireducens JCM 10879 TaxID=1227454 RepID=M0M0S5_9EURY|nr:hypothetical protein [Halobiforma nitratireducens]EMA38229.1 hypothetical protein C446_10280 [Halobiforma nitratireducens JCM 10879]
MKSTSTLNGIERGTRLLVVAAVVVLAVAAMAGGVQAMDDLPGATDDGTVELELMDEGDETVTVAVATSESDVAGFQANVSYAADEATVEQVEFEDVGGMSHKNTDTDGYVALTQSTTGDNSVDEPTLATVTFVLEDDEPSFGLVDADTSVSDGDGKPIVGDDGDDDDGGSAPGGGGGGIGGDTGSDDDGDADDSDDATTTGTDDEAGEDENGTEESDGDDTESEETDETDESTTDGGDDDNGDDSDDIPGFTAVGTAVAAVIALLALGARTRVRRDG